MTARTQLQTEDEVVGRLKFVCNFAGSQSAVAKAIGISASGLNAVIRGKRKPHPCILKYLGLKKVTMYAEDRQRSE
jgi:hypothetical protein